MTFLRKSLPLALIVLWLHNSSPYCLSPTAGWCFPRITCPFPITTFASGTTGNRGARVGWPVCQFGQRHSTLLLTIGTRPSRLPAEVPKFALRTRHLRTAKSFRIWSGARLCFCGQLTHIATRKGRGGSFGRSELWVRFALTLKGVSHSFSAMMVAIQCSANRFQRTKTRPPMVVFCLPSSALPEL